MPNPLRTLQSNRIRRRLLAAALATAALALTVTIATGSIGHRHRRTAAHFTLHGRVRGLYPGVRKRLKIVVHNPGRRALTVRSITTHVRDASAACKARNLHVSAFHGRLRVRGHRSRRVAVKVRMRRDSPAACQGGIFRLAFHGRGRT
jgi:hypothetical protein